MKSSSPLISAQELDRIKLQSNVKLFDVRGKWKGDQKEALAAYKNSHIEGAVYLDWTFHFLNPDIPIHLAPVADKENALESFKALGICSEDTVILYDDYKHMLAGRIWWALRYFGFDNVKILDGGWQSWTNQNLPTCTTIPKIKQGNFSPVTNEGLRLQMADLNNIKEEVNLIDGRGIKGYLGDANKLRTGHIPGAINIGSSEVLDSETGLFKTKEELQLLFNSKFPYFETKKVISSCGSGYSGTVPMIALMKIGIEAPLFDGSFAEWSADLSLPVQQGNT